MAGGWGSGTAAPVTSPKHEKTPLQRGVSRYHTGYLACGGKGRRLFPLRITVAPFWPAVMPFR